MGNTVGVDSTPVAFDGLDKLRKRAQTPRFSANLKAWRLSSDANRRCVTRVAPLDWATTSSFDAKSCYLLLHTYDLATHPARAELGVVNSTAIDLATSAAEGLTPRGLRNAFSCGEDNPNLNAFPHLGGPSPACSSSFGVFLWNGKDADAVVKATALTKAFELERLLLDESNVERLFNNDNTTTSLATQLHAGKPQNSASRVEVASFTESNELFRWIAEGPGRAYEKEGVPNWPHVADAISAGKRERGETEYEPRKRPEGRAGGGAGGSPSAVAPLKTTPRSQPPNLPNLSLGNLKSLDVSQKQVMGKSESAIRQGELDRFRGVCSEVLPYLYVGAELVARDEDLLKQHGITHIINCAGTVIENFHEDSFKYLKLYLYDAKTEDLGCLFYEIIAFIDEARQAGGKCFVHCHQGVSRSCTSCIAYLIAKHGLTYDDAFAKVQTARAICNPNTGFICQLLDFYRRLHEPLEKTRGFRVARHSNFPDSPYCARSVGPGAGPLKREECVILHTASRVLLWRGQAADDETMQSARQHVARIQESEGAPHQCDTITAGQETSSFWSAAVGCGFSIPHDAAGSPQPQVEDPRARRDEADLAAEDEAMRMGNRPKPAPAKLVPPEPTGFELLKMQMPPDDNPEPQSVRGPREPDAQPRVEKVENEDEGKLFTYPDWEQLEMFDSDDLVGDMAMVLLPNKRPPECVYVWMGEDFLEDEGYTKGAEIAGEFLALKGLPSTTEVKMEIEADESDAFWDYFVNG